MLLAITRTHSLSQRTAAIVC